MQPFLFVIAGILILLGIGIIFVIFCCIRLSSKQNQQNNDREQLEFIKNYRNQKNHDDASNSGASSQTKS